MMRNPGSHRRPGVCPFYTLCCASSPSKSKRYAAWCNCSFYQRPDLQLTGRTLIGKMPARGQELCDHYMSALSTAQPAFECMKEIQAQCLALGIPLKTRHREVAHIHCGRGPLEEGLHQQLGRVGLLDHGEHFLELVQRLFSPAFLGQQGRQEGERAKTHQLGRRAQGIGTVDAAEQRFARPTLISLPKKDDPAGEQQERRHPILAAMRLFVELLEPFLDRGEGSLAIVECHRDMDQGDEGVEVEPNADSVYS